MNITQKSDMRHYLHKIIKEDCHSFRVEKDGSLIINGKEKTRKYLAYINGQWYGGKGEACAIPNTMRNKTGENLYEFSEQGKHLFIISEKRFWMMLNDGSAEYASPTKSLEYETVAFLMAEHGPGLCLYVIDGSKHSSALAAKIDLCAHGLDLAATIVIALTREYDEEIADQMDDFWFGKNMKNEIADSDDESILWDA